LSQREVWIVDVPGHGSIVVVRVEGRVGYPVELDTKNAPPRFIVREAGKKKWLTSEQARVRRGEIDARRLRWRHILIGSLPALFLAGVSLALVEYAATHRVIVTGNGVVEYVIKWREPGSRWWSNTGSDGSIAFMHDQSLIIKSKSMRGFIQRVSDDEVRVSQYFELVSPLEVASVSLSQFRTTNRAVIWIPLLKAIRERAAEGWAPVGGTINITLNSSYHVIIEIPPQTLDSDIIAVPHVRPMP
jgi:hypothetical protein